MHLVTFRSEEQSEFGFDAAYELMYRILIFFSDLLIDALPSEVHVYARGKLKPTPENVHLYRDLSRLERTWRDEPRRNDGNHKLANPHAPKHAAALAQRRQR